MRTRRSLGRDRSLAREASAQDRAARGYGTSSLGTPLEGSVEPGLLPAHETLDENRFLAGRDGISAMLVDPAATAAARAPAAWPPPDRLSAGVAG
jgi:hypothetical protein